MTLCLCLCRIPGHYARISNNIHANNNGDARVSNVRGTQDNSYFDDIPQGDINDGSKFGTISSCTDFVNISDSNNSSNDSCYLLRGVDPKKDQSYFLAGLKQSVLRRTLFPLGGMLKSDVKQRARDLGLSSIAAQKESMGICFIGKRRLELFLREYIDQGSGKKILVKANGSGCIDVGKHKGLHSLTLGQRASVGGLKAKPYVAGKHLGTKEIFVVEGEDNPALFSHSFAVSDLQWTAGSAPWELCSDTNLISINGKPKSSRDDTSTSRYTTDSVFECMVQIRHQHSSFRSTLISCMEQALPVEFENPDLIGYVPPIYRRNLSPGEPVEQQGQWRQHQRRDTKHGSEAKEEVVIVTTEHKVRAPTPGQSVAFYDSKDKVCLGGGTIVRTGPTIACSSSYAVKVS